MCVVERKCGGFGAIHVLWNSEDDEGVPDFRHSTVYIVGVKFCLALIVNVPWVFPLKIRSM